MSEQQKLGEIQNAKKICNQIKMKINENILFRTLLWGNKIGRLLENFSKKGSSGEHTIVLNESDKMVNDQKEVANHFNNFFSTVAENKGKYTVYDPSDHPSLLEI